MRYQHPSLQLFARVTCPHCWKEFSPEEILWISAHSDLGNDSALGEDEQQRFLPTRFDASGNAIDIKGASCKDLACPHCHLSMNRSLLEMRPLFISFLGAPSSGKTYYLASMINQLDRTLKEKFSLTSPDTDPLENRILGEYRRILFRNSRDDQIVSLPKTEQKGELY